MVFISGYGLTFESLEYSEAVRVHDTFINYPWCTIFTSQNYDVIIMAKTTMRYGVQRDDEIIPWDTIHELSNIMLEYIPISIRNKVSVGLISSDNIFSIEHSEAGAYTNSTFGSDDETLPLTESIVSNNMSYDSLDLENPVIINTGEDSWIVHSSPNL